MNPSPDQPSQLEPVPVQLTRMEGTINLIAYQFGEVKEDLAALRKDVHEHTKDITALQLAQASASGASSSWKTWLPTILTAVGLLVALGFGVKFGG